MKQKRVLLIVMGIAGALVLAVGGTGFWLLGQAKKSDAVTAEAALERFQSEDDGTRDVAGAPDPGVYTYDVVGSEAGGAASVKVSRDLPPSAQMTVWQTEGGFRTELVYSGDHLEAASYTVGDEGVAQTATRTRLSILGSTSDDTFEVNPPALWIPAAPTKGDTWEASFEAGGFTTAYASTVTGTEVVTVGAAKIDTVVIERTTTYSGGVTGSYSDTFWWSTELRLPVKIAVKGESKQGIGVFSQDSTATLSSPEPLV